MSRWQPTKRIRRLVAERAQFCCEYCQAQQAFATESFEVEHIVPVILGGSNDLENLAFSCSGCNNSKGIIHEVLDPITLVSTPIFNPRTQNWTDHFIWNEDMTRIIGLTAMGRVTVEQVRLNRTPLLNLRRALIAIQEHPPIL